MKELDLYKKECLKHDLCTTWQTYWIECKSLKDFMDLALKIDSVKWLCESIANGWGLNPTFISKKFKKYINGSYVFTDKKYDSEMYCQYIGDIEMRTNVLCLIDFKGEVHIPNGLGCHIYVCGDSDIILKGGERSRIICYICDNKSKVLNDCKGECNERNKD